MSFLVYLLIFFFVFVFLFFFFNDTATTEIYTLSLHDALPICARTRHEPRPCHLGASAPPRRSEEHTSELQSRRDLVCRLLLEKKKHTTNQAAAAKTGSYLSVNIKRYNSD